MKTFTHAALFVANAAELICTRFPGGESCQWHAAGIIYGLTYTQRQYLAQWYGITFGD